MCGDCTHGDHALLHVLVDRFFIDVAPSLTVAEPGQLILLLVFLGGSRTVPRCRTGLRNPSAAG
jgi:hypothetical protein